MNNYSIHERQAVTRHIQEQAREAEARGDIARRDERLAVARRRCALGLGPTPRDEARTQMSTALRGGGFIWGANHNAARLEWEVYELEVGIRIRWCDGVFVLQRCGRWKGAWWQNVMTRKTFAPVIRALDEMRVGARAAYAERQARIVQ